MTALYLGVDGGQSSTTAWIADESGRVLGRGHAGPCNHARAAEGRVKFLTALHDCLAAACGDAGLDPSEVTFASACLGLSGGPAGKEDLVRQTVRARRYQVTHDASIALAGATAGAPGVIVIAGTGSMAFGRNAAGQTARAGGWGYIYGDEGGAFDIVREAIRAVLRDEEGWGAPTALRSALLEVTGAATANELMHLGYSDNFPRDRVAGFAPLVNRTALDGDPVALEIVHRAGRQLATLAEAVHSQLFPEPEPEPVTVSYAGGVFQSPYILERFRTLVERRTAATRVAPPLHPPVAGALFIARS